MQPIISIITVTYNAGQVLEKTIRSIVSQTAFANVEYIIVDGASKDNTTDIIRQHEHHVSRWISEPDKGLYDAMNKGIAMATGDYVWFINAGDEIYENDTLEKILQQPSGADIYYGETLETTEAGETIGMRRLSTPEQLDWKSFQWGMLVCHQSILVKREIAGNYDLSYRIAADIDWVISALKKSTLVINTHLVLSRFAKGGTSGKHIKKALRERFGIMTRNYGFMRTVFNHVVIGTKFFWFLMRNKRF
ncbi:MAG: glycosyltransferase family 2 protein [Bacteroidota bacterium]